MSPASRSKSKDKKASKELQKASSKPSGANAASAVATSAYNPLSGTFHALETVISSSASSLHTNGRFRNIDESDGHVGVSLGAGVEYDSVSNNGSWSGESEDHKERASNPPVRQETVSGADNDKREKIRQKNERKHQRQKERRAQELHERCNSYLMSRKLEVLAQQLVSMGFQQDQATQALMLNEGKLEESVAWLFEGGEEADKKRDLVLGEGNLKIDISEELARIADLEIRYKCTKQEVERAVVAAEGDLERAAEALKSAKQDSPARSKPEELGDLPTVNNGKLSVTSSQSLVSRPQPKQLPTSVQPRRDDRDPNYTKASVALAGSSESANKNVQPMKRVPPKVDWGKPQQIEMPPERKWLNVGGSNPSASYSLASAVQPSPAAVQTEARYMAANDLNNPQPSVREPVIMMQRSQSVNSKQAPVTNVSSSPSGSAGGWYPTSSSMETMKSNGFMHHIPMTRSLSPPSLNSAHMYLNQLQNQQQQHLTASNLTASNVLGDQLVTSSANGLWSRVGAPSSSLAAASSLGLFSASGSSSFSGAACPVDWSSGRSMTQFDYTSIDWSLDRGMASPRPGGFWAGHSSSLQNSQVYDSNTNPMSSKPAMRLIPSGGNGVSMTGLQDGGGVSEASAASSREWTSPFEGKDLFSVPRKFVSSPSL